MGIVLVNGRDVAELGLRLTDLSGAFGGLNVQRQAVAMPFGFGQTVSEVETYPAREISVQLYTDEGGGWTVQNREARLAEVRELLTGVVEVAFVESALKVLCRLESETASGWTSGMSFTHQHTSMSWTLRAYQVARLSVEDRVVGFTTTPGAVQVGDFARAAGIILISGAATDPVVTLRNFRGEVVGGMAFQQALTASQALEVDLYEEVIWLRSGGTRTRADASLVDGDFFEFRPEHRGPSGAWPTIEVSDGFGLLTHRVLWR